MLIKKIDSKLNSFELYTLCKDRQYSFFLDSGMDHGKLGKYSFIGYDPFLVFKSKNERITILENDKITEYTGDPFEKLKLLLKQYHREYKADLPFVGGAVGYLAYDLCHHIEKIPRTAVDDVDIPDCFLGFYDGIIIVDHGNQDVYIAALGLNESPKAVMNRMVEYIHAGEMKDEKPEILKKPRDVVFKSNFEKEEYFTAVQRVKEYIRSGDIYQANLTQRFTCEMQDSPFQLYAKLREINPAPFASFLDFGEGYIVSSSPERFIQIRDRMIETRPIKGTRPRGKTPEEDAKNKEELLASEKDQSELLMIVDLERNDLGKISKTGTVEVTELFHLEEYPTVFHLVSTVRGKLKDECDVVDCLKATFPGGSITGAPKIRAMEIIDELEPTQRNVYTGSIGYIGFNGDVDLNIVIRTIVCKDGKAYFQTGGGIVWDSDPQSEYEETFHKARALMEALKG